MTAADTSLEAFASIQHRIKYDRVRILRAIVASGNTGKTCDEIEVELGMSHQTASARMTDLADDEHIERTTVRRKTRSGRPAGVCVATIAGIAAAT